MNEPRWHDYWFACVLGALLWLLLYTVGKAVGVWLG
jgi:hypothetical protein